MSTAALTCACFLAMVFLSWQDKQRSGTAAVSSFGLRWNGDCAGAAHAAGDGSMQGLLVESCLVMTRYNTGPARSRKLGAGFSPACLPAWQESQPMSSADALSLPARLSGWQSEALRLRGLLLLRIVPRRRSVQGKRGKDQDKDKTITVLRVVFSITEF